MQGQGILCYATSPIAMLSGLEEVPHLYPLFGITFPYRPITGIRVKKTF